MGRGSRSRGFTVGLSASLDSGWPARGGLLRLHDDHLSFIPSPMEKPLFARYIRIDFTEITAVQRHPEREGEYLPGGVSPRMRLITEERAYDVVFIRGLDDWMASVKERRYTWENRQRFL
jgi:hypothetical protein